MRRISKSARIQLWLDRLGRHSQSGQTVSEFCKQEQISVPSFYQWKRRLTPKVESATADRKQLRKSSRSPIKVDNQAGFTELVVHSPQASAQASLPGGITISLGTDTEVASLIVDRLLQHSASLSGAETTSC